MNCATILQLWRKWIGFVVFVVYSVLLLIALPLTIVEMERKGAPDHVEAWFIGGLFVMMALPISFWGILQHVINYTEPHLQRHIIRVLWMVPVYALNAWFALRFPSAAIYLDTLRECYEAYVIYNFMAYLLSFLNHEYPHLDIQIENKPPVKHIFPFCLLPPSQNSVKFVQRCKHGVLQYTVVRPAMTVIALICEMFNKYQEGDFNFSSGWSYIVIINNLSQILAMYCLVLFYKAFKEELQPLKPVPKFLCVKAVVFLSFWQALFIAILVKVGAIPQNGTWIFYKDIKEVATGLQDFLICIEMFLAAIAHYYSFSHKPFVNLAASQQNCCASFLSMWDVRDVTQDVMEHARYVGRGMHKTLSRGKRLATSSSGTEQTERSPLLAGSSNQGGVSDRHVTRQTSVQTYQNQQPPSPAIILDEDNQSSGGESLAGRRYDMFVNKSTTSSMNNYIDLDSEATGQNENRRDLSRSVSLKVYDSSDGDEGIDAGISQVSNQGDLLHINNSKHEDSAVGHREDFEHLDVHNDDKKDLQSELTQGGNSVSETEENRDSQGVSAESGTGLQQNLNSDVQEETGKSPASDNQVKDSGDSENISNLPSNAITISGSPHSDSHDPVV